MEQFSPNIYPLRAENNNVVCVHDQFHKLFNYYGHILIRVTKTSGIYGRGFNIDKVIF